MHKLFSMRDVKKIASVVIAVVLLVVLLSLCSCRQGNTTEYLTPEDNTVYMIDADWSKEFISSDLKLTNYDDMTWTQRIKLYDFYHLGTFNEQIGGSIFRNMGVAGGNSAIGLENISGRIDVSVLQYFNDHNCKGPRSCPYLFYQKIDEHQQEWDQLPITFFDGRQNKRLDAGEIVVSKYAYYTLYVAQKGMTLTKAETLQVIESDDVYAKYVLLRNCPAQSGGFADGIAIEYYGLDQMIEKVPLTIRVYSMEEQIKTYTDDIRIVGFFNIPGAIDLAGRPSDLDNVCGYKYDTIHAPGFYHRFCEYLEENSLQLKGKTEEEILKNILAITYRWDLEGENDFSYEVDEVLHMEMHGTIGNGILGKSMCVYGK